MTMPLRSLPSATSQAHGVRIVGRLRLRPMCSTKGFGGADDGAAPKTAQSVKVNERGKVASRQGTLSRKEAARRLEEFKQQQDTAAAAPAASTAAGSDEQQQQRQRQEAASSASSSAPTATPGRRLPSGGLASRVETPQVVVDRMFGRMLLFLGAPLALGILLFPLFWYLRVVQKIEYPLWIVSVAEGLTFGAALLGITYGVLSTSWDPRREGTALGWTEFKANLGVLLDSKRE